MSNDRHGHRGKGLYVVGGAASRMDDLPRPLCEAEMSGPLDPCGWVDDVAEHSHLAVDSVCLLPNV
jgi:hypothetical protein